MCAVSAIGDFYQKKWYDELAPQYPGINPTPLQPLQPSPPAVTREEFESLKKIVQEMHDILKVAKDYDDRTNQPHCEMEEKVALLKKLAEIVGVDMDDVFGKD